MAFEAILDEVDQLNLAGDRIEGLAEHQPPVSEVLISIAGNVRSTATVLALLVETSCEVVTATPRFLRSRSNHAAAARFYSGVFAFNQRLDFVINLKLHWRAA
jgi:hypothetical protein